MMDDGIERRPSIVHVLERSERRAGLRKALESEGYEYLEAHDLPSAHRLIPSAKPSLILFQDTTFWSVHEFLRSRLLQADGAGAQPVIVLGPDDEADELVCLALGAADYLPRGGSIKRLLARVRLAISRSQAVAPAAPAIRVIDAGPIRLDPSRYEVFVDGAAVHLTVSEFKLLHEVVAASGRVVPRMELMSRVFGIESEVETRRIDVHVVGLRRKLGDAADWLRTIRSLGYAWRSPVLGAQRARERSRR